ncbi:FIST signal transduction protein [Dongia soli]|uniref:FIST N-terminal domain-containing protein n=1 Tax=Dongia soli TaxID=600628 RepID=A0ABU5EKN8_9PROT|nr:FIST N-terminal domain-containing protein [Dongia soli]MDY0885785.1 FIST N-terminal domain-containing protein [Dongia soli]
MKAAQYKWSQSDGLRPNLPAGEVGRQSVVFVFGARSLMQAGDLVGQLRDHFKGATMLGCSTSGEILGDTVLDDSVTATLVDFEHTRLRSASVTIGEAKASYEVGKQLAQLLSDASLRHVFVLSDGLHVNGSDLARGLTGGVAEGVSITGGLSGDGTNFAETWVIADDAVGSQRVAAVGLYGEDLRIGYGSMGGWVPFGPLRTVTLAEGNILYELDERSALDLYKSYLGSHADQLPSSALLFPILVTEPKGGQGVVRTVLSVDEQKKSMTFAGEIPQGGTAQLMKTNVDDLVDGATAAAKASLSGLGDRRPDVAILVSCVGRKLVMKQRTEEEIEAIRNVFGTDTKISGFYSYGELCPFMHGGECRLHNQTMTITTFVEV